MVDLVDRFFSAQVRTAPPLIDFGTPAARPFMVEGWGPDAKSRWRTFVWGLGDRSTVRLFLDQPLDLVLTLVCRPARGSRHQRISVVVNGQETAEVTLTSEGWREYRVVVPASVLVAGNNLITFRYPYTFRPFEVIEASKDARPLAAAWRELRIEGLRYFGEPEARPHARPPTLTIPYGVQVEYFLELTPGSELIFQGVEAWGRHRRKDWVLQIAIDGAAGKATQNFEISPSSVGLRFPLTSLPARGPSRLALRARIGADSIKGKRAGLRLIAPAIKLPQSSSAPPDSPTVGRSPKPGSAAVVPAAGPRPNVIIYLIDALRADHLGCYGYSLPTSPRIDAFSSDAVLFTHTVAQASWTRPAVASLFTGLHPQVHGANGAEDSLPREVATLPELLAAAGYRTGAVTTNGVISQTFGFDRGFDFFEYLPERHRFDEIHQQSDKANEVALKWLGQVSGEPPYFLYLHTTDPHAPYVARPPYAEQFAAQVADPRIGLHANVEDLKGRGKPITKRLQRDLMALYDAEIAFNDASFGRLVDWLRAHDQYDSSLIVLVADHGEEFFDHGRWQHGLSLFNEQLRVPLILKFPEQWGAGKRPALFASQVDLLPTILDYLAVAVPEAVQGRSLLPAIRSPGNEPDSRPAFAYLGKYPEHREVRTVFAGDFKLIEYQMYDTPRAAVELFDLARDPGEKTNLAWERPIRTGYLLSLLKTTARYWQTIGSREVEIDPQLKENLRALGYLE